MPSLPKICLRGGMVRHKVNVCRLQAGCSTPASKGKAIELTTWLDYWFNKKLDSVAFAWFWGHPPICNCPHRVKMRFDGENKTYVCYQCGLVVRWIAAGADLRDISVYELDKIKFVAWRDKR
jgi:hypothetical protein